MATLRISVRVRINSITELKIKIIKLMDLVWPNAEVKVDYVQNATGGVVVGPRPTKTDLGTLRVQPRSVTLSYLFF